MLVGESGLGKTTFTRALFRPFMPEKHGKRPMRDPIRGRTPEIEETKHKVENDGYPVEFTVVDCPGFGDALDSTASIDKICDYVTSRFARYYEASSASHEGGSFARDELVHVCLYFISAHRLKGVDLEFMRRLNKMVNLVPVIAKADTMTVGERDSFRRLIASELRACGVKVFELGPPHPADADGAGPRLGTTRPPPFAVSASEDGVREYPWGTCRVEDPAHSDLSLLRRLLSAAGLRQLCERVWEAHWAVVELCVLCDLLHGLFASGGL